MDTRFVATLLRTSASAFAALTVTRALESSGHEAESGVDFEAWKEHFRTLVQELAAAVDGGNETQFTTRVEWARQAFVARGLEIGLLRSGLEELHAVLDESLPGGAAEPLPGLLRAADRVFASTPAAEPAGSSGEALGELAQDYLADLHAGDGWRAIERIVAAVRAKSLSVADALDGVLTPVLRETGRRWHAGEWSVAEEHFATQTTGRLLDQLTLLATRDTAPARTVLLTMVAGDAHELGVRIVSAFFELEGWRTICLGANTPPEDLALCAQRYDVDLVVIGATLNTQREAVARAIEVVRSTRPDQKVLVGGSAFQGLEEQGREIGADGCVLHAREAPRLALELFER